MLKKICMIIVVCLIVTGCTPVVSKEEPSAYFVFAAPLSEHPVWLQSKAGFDKACNELNLRCDWIGPIPIDITKMEETINTAIMQKADAIITQGVISEAVINRAIENEIKIALVDSDMEDIGEHLYLGKNFKMQAELLLADIQENYGKQKYLKIAIQVAALDFSIAQNQIEEIRNIFQSHPGGFEIVEISESRSDKARSQNEWEETIQHQDINVAINFAGEGASICGEVANKYNKRNQMLIYGADDMEETLNSIKTGSIDGSIVTSFYKYGYLSVYKLYDELYHKFHEVSQEEPVLILVNQINLNTYKEGLK